MKNVNLFDKILIELKYKKYRKYVKTLEVDIKYLKSLKKSAKNSLTDVSRCTVIFS